MLDGGSGEAKPGGAYVLPHVRIVVETVVGGGVPLLVLYAVVHALTLPGNETLVVQAVREKRRLKHPGSALAYAVLNALDAVLALEDGVLAVEEDGELLLIVISLTLCLGEAGIPPFKLLLGGTCGIVQIQGIYAGPEEGVSFGLEGIYHQPVGEGVLDGYIPLIEEGVRKLQAVRHLHGVTGVDLWHGVLLRNGKKVKVFLICQAVKRTSGR